MVQSCPPRPSPAATPLAVGATQPRGESPWAGLPLRSAPLQPPGSQGQGTPGMTCIRPILMDSTLAGHPHRPPPQGRAWKPRSPSSAPSPTQWALQGASNCPIPPAAPSALGSVTGPGTPAAVRCAPRWDEPAPGRRPRRRSKQPDRRVGTSPAVRARFRAHHRACRTPLTEAVS